MSAPENTIEVTRILRPQTKLDIVVKSDLVASQADVRGTVVLDIDPIQMIVAQTNPPILSSMVGQSVEATIATFGCPIVWTSALLTRSKYRWAPTRNR